jgi:hypothetical protein
MGLTILLTICWLLLTIWTTYPKKLSRRECVFLFMVILDINISVSWILGYELGKIEISKQTSAYLMYVVYRSVLVPLLPVLCINLLLICRTFLQKTLPVAGYLVAIWGLETLCIRYKAFTFPDFNMLEALVVAGSYLLIAVLLLKWFRNAFAKEEVGLP